MNKKIIIGAILVIVFVVAILAVISTQPGSAFPTSPQVPITATAKPTLPSKASEEQRNGKVKVRYGRIVVPKRRHLPAKAA